jgi:TRAP-type uncharacterized transport system substrate-binding protein
MRIPARASRDAAKMVRIEVSACNCGVANGDGVPLHPGAARHYRELGCLMNTAEAAK